MGDEQTPADQMRLALMELADNLAPFHELAMGEVAYFLRQGFTREQALGMVAAEFTSVFGTRILPTATGPEE